MRIGNRPVLWRQDDARPREDTLAEACLRILDVIDFETAVSKDDDGETTYYVMPSGHVVVASYPGACAIWGPELSEEWLVYTLMERGHGDVYLWWGPNHSGYTRYIENAGRYSEEEARKIVGLRVGLGHVGAPSRDGAASVRLSDAKAMAKSVVPYGALENKKAT